MTGRVWNPPLRSKESRRADQVLRARDPAPCGPPPGSRARPFPPSLQPRGFTAVTTLQKPKTGDLEIAEAPRAGRAWPFRPHVVWAVFKRDFASYFSNP